MENKMYTSYFKEGKEKLEEGGSKRTKEEMIRLFKKYAFEFEKQARRNGDLSAEGKAEAYTLAAFELEKNMI